MARQAIQIHRASTPSSPSGASPEPKLLEHIAGTSSHYLWRGEKVHYRTLGNGPPLLLAHMPDVGASCLEWRRNIEALAATHTVYAPDLPGFGLSEVRRGPYTAELYILFLSDFIHEVTGTGADVIGSGLGGSYLLHVADRLPGLIQRLLLIAPAGLTAFLPNPLRGLTFQMLRLPLLFSAVCNTATTRYTILEHLQNDIFADERLAGPQAVESRYWVCHRPNAVHVERSRLAGLLNVDIRAAAKRLQQPILLAWGREATRPPLADAELFREINPGALLAVFEKSSVSPHEEEAGRFNQTARSFFGMGQG